MANSGIEHPTLPLEKLRWKLDTSTLSFDTTKELDPLEEIIGQKRGEEALRFGMAMRKKGYNIFVTGQSGTGRLSTVKKLLKEISKPNKTPDDLCFVNNFEDEDAPRLLRFPAGQGQEFKKDIQDFLESIKRDVPELFESQEYISRKKAIMEAHEKKTREFFKGLEEKVKDSGFVLVNMQVGQVQRPEVVPLVDNEPVHMLNLEERVEKGRFPKDEFEELKTKHAELKEEIDSIFMDIRDLQKEVKKKSDEMDKLLFSNTVEDLVKPLRRKYAQERIQNQLESMVKHMSDHLDEMKALGGRPQEGPFPGMMMGPNVDAILHPYQVNLMVNNGEADGPPVIIESYPTYRNLFGSIERVMDRGGVWRTDFMKINAGSFIKANGGYLVINLMDAIMEPGVWQTLKRALKTSEIEIQTFDPYYMFTASGLKPEPVAMDVKVVVMAEPSLYHMLGHYDPDMRKIFKVRADFDTAIDKTDEVLPKFAAFVRNVNKENEYRPMDRSGFAALMEQAVRMAGRQEKLTSAFPVLEDLIAEADYHAGLAKSDVVRSEHMEAAIDARIYRSSQVEEQLQEMIDRGSVFIDVDGAKTGQINGLAVYSMGDYMFGKPSRITAATSMGKEGIINIEREADMSGAIHNKGMLILAGFLRERFAQDKPLTLAASIAFEQNYGGIDGDSASSTELYALLSALSGVPINQGIAVTGSVNQRGEVQPIGGANQKIEGYYKCCKMLGLTGKQGVMIPEANVKDLMLRQEVLDAVEKGDFRIWSVRTIEQGIEILTGVAAGEKDENGMYPDDSIYGLVDRKLTEYAEGLRDFGKTDEEDKDGSKGGDKCGDCDGC